MRRAAVLVAFALGILLVAGCGGAETTAPKPETVRGTIEQPTVKVGDAAAGKAVFAAQGCGSCHTYGPANAKGNVGPNLDEALQGRDAEFVDESIVNPNAEVAEGFQPGIMPQNYGQTLSDKQLADLVAFLLPKQS
jgi:mono/diheme cytochrome c family protein